jgi:ABC-type nitrate/sulfonate/bicarbonate transport system substrate-binding protein
MPLRARLVRAIALSAALAAAAPAGAQPRDTVHVTYSENMYGVIAVVAIEKGYLARQGLDVRHATEGSGSEVLESLVSGSTDFGVASPSRLIAIAARRLPVKAVALNSYGFTSSVVVPARDRTSRTMTDLRGRIVGVQPGTGTYAVWVRYLRTQGLSVRDFAVKQTSNTLIPAAMEAGSLDAAVTWEPSPSRLVASGLGRVLLGPAELAGAAESPYPFFLITTARLVAERPDVVQKVVTAWGESLRYIRENPDDVARIMQRSMMRTRGISLSVEDARQAIYLTRYDRLLVSDADVRDTEAIARVFVEEGKVRAVGDIRAVVDNRFAEQIPGAR